ncbi:uncharacterized protein TNIN_112561 [Trichonephila inaurata madagascariensis]|uniref:Uncharacterized protein n=1 Tax=Trichonephila inaurata madagascariensis TaxID=2747483 RepID=A0A8X6XIN1_9ARAC|nr:uncharacterized protein TNIN_112561 [Trichonephila inaurata madagascariensis]
MIGLDMRNISQECEQLVTCQEGGTYLLICLFHQNISKLDLKNQRYGRNEGALIATNIDTGMVTLFGYFQSLKIWPGATHKILGDQFGQLFWVPSTEEHLETLCPLVLESMRCIADEIETCIKMDIFQLAASENKTLSAIGNLFMNTGKFIMDLCDKESDLRRNYLASASCFKDLVVDPEPTMKCHREGNAVYELYAKSLNLLAEQSNEVTDNEVSEEVEEREGSEHWCMVTAYTLACFSAELQDRCGGLARTTFVDFLKRFQSLKWNECSDIDLINLRSKFLDFLELEEERRGIYSEVFNTKRRRK